jgi:hypothetical protein
LRGAVRNKREKNSVSFRYFCFGFWAIKAARKFLGVGIERQQQPLVSWLTFIYSKKAFYAVKYGLSFDHKIACKSRQIGRSFPRLRLKICRFRAITVHTIKFDAKIVAALVVLIKDGQPRKEVGPHVTIVQGHVVVIFEQVVASQDVLHAGAQLMHLGYEPQPY